MKLEIRRLGPLRNSRIELGDITLFLGPPNTGKSYTLRAIYAKLFPLDNYSLEYVREEFSGNLSKHLRYAFSEHIYTTLIELFKILTKFIIISALYLKTGEKTIKLEQVLANLLKKSNFLGDVMVQKDFIKANIKTNLNSVNINIKILNENMKKSIHKFITELIPLENTDSVRLYPIDILPLSIDFIRRMQEYQKILIKRPRQPSTVLENSYYYVINAVLEELLHGPREYEEKSNVFFFRLSYLRPGIDNLRFSTKVLELHIRPETSQDKIKLIYTLNFEFKVHLDISIISAIKKRLSDISIDLNYIEEIIDDAFNKAIAIFGLDDIIKRGAEYLGKSIAEIFARHISRIIFGNELREIFKNHIGCNNLRFIPFGRSMFVLGLESASKEPFTRPKHLRSFVEELYPSIIASYVYWASKGRSHLLESKKDEHHVKLLKAAMPLLEGKLVPGPAWSLSYKDWRGSSIDLQMSSALVEEVSGLLFALLSIEDTSGCSIVLIEEPEAQLHPGAQIAMALFLASLPSLCKCRVVASTHSDLLAITLSQLVMQKPTKDWVKELLNRLLPHIGEQKEGTEGIDALAEAVANSVRNLNLRIYEFKREGRINFVKPADVLSKEVPGISRVIDELTDWAFRLASYQLDPETIRDSEINEELQQQK